MPFTLVPPALLASSAMFARNHCHELALERVTWIKAFPQLQDQHWWSAVSLLQNDLALKWAIRKRCCPTITFHHFPLKKCSELVFYILARRTARPDDPLSTSLCPRYHIFVMSGAMPVHVNPRFDAPRVLWVARSFRMHSMPPSRASPIASPLLKLPWVAF